MITFQFEFSENAINQILAALLSLPPILRPIHFDENEESHRARKLISNEKLFSDFRKRNDKIGFFLFSSGIIYNISFKFGKLLLSGEMEIEEKLVEQLVVHMSKAQPSFGFACSPDERKCRNRITIKIGTNTIESWVGRDQERYIPGLYWLTLISEQLIEKHKIRLSTIVRAAKDHIVLGDELHFFRFYNAPADWQSDKHVPKVIVEETGIFNAEKVKPWLTTARDIFEANAVFDDWP